MRVLTCARLPSSPHAVNCRACPTPLCPTLRQFRVQHVRNAVVLDRRCCSHARTLRKNSVNTMAAQIDSNVQPAKSQTLPDLPALDDTYQDTVKFTPYANWLIPGHLMVGRYPYVEPSRCPSREKGEAQVRKIVEAGITTFVCLQEELPSQDKMKIGGHNGFMPYMSVAKGIAASLTGPSETAEMDGLRNPHVDKFLPPKRNKDTSGQRQLGFVFDPIVDLNLPDKDQMLALVDQLKGFITDGQVVYMHCWGGRGRAGTIASCFLASCYNLSPDETADRIQLAFDTRQDGGRRSPETPDQREFVKNFITELIKTKQEA